MKLHLAIPALLIALTQNLPAKGGGGGSCGGHGGSGSAEVIFDTDYWKDEMTTTVHFAGFRFRVDRTCWGLYPAASNSEGPGYLGRFVEDTVAIHVYRVETSRQDLLKKSESEGWKLLTSREVMTGGGVHGTNSTWARKGSSVESRITFLCENDNAESILFDARPTKPAAHLWRAGDFLMDKLGTARPAANNLWELLTLPFKKSQ